MLSLTRKTDYALQALVAMARSSAGKVSARDIATQSGISVRLLTNILNRLKHEGLVESTRGTKGGYGLAVAPEHITLANLIEAVEGPVRLARCCSKESEGHEDRCNLESSCQTKDAVRRLHGSLRHFLSQVTVRDMAWDTVTLNVGVSKDNGHGRIGGDGCCNGHQQPAVGRGSSYVQS